MNLPARVSGRRARSAAIGDHLVSGKIKRLRPVQLLARIRPGREVTTGSEDRLMRDPEEWRRRGVHWHAYAEVRDGGEAHDGGREVRLARSPDAVLCTPDAVVEWIAELTRGHVRQRSVFLMGPRGDRGEWGETGDADHLEHDMSGDHLIAARGDSLYADVPRRTDRLHLWAEAVTADECHRVWHRRETESQWQKQR